MTSVRSMVLLATLYGSASFGLAWNASAQGTSTTSIRGTLRIDGEGGGTAGGAQVRVINTATGGATVRVTRWRFVAQGLEFGGPYVVEVRQIGFQPHVASRSRSSSARPSMSPFVLRRAPTQLDEVLVNAEVRQAMLARQRATKPRELVAPVQLLCSVG